MTREKSSTSDDVKTSPSSGKSARSLIRNQQPSPKLICFFPFIFSVPVRRKCIRVLYVLYKAAAVALAAEISR